MKFLLLAAFIASTCQTGPFPPQPNPDPVPFPPEPMGGAAPIVDAGPPPDIDRSVLDACENAHRIGCSEAQPVETCEVITQRALKAQLTVVPLACMVGATSKATIRACGFVACR